MQYASYFSHKGETKTYIGTKVLYQSTTSIHNDIDSYEAEYIAGSYAACQGLWIENLLAELKIDVKRPLKLMIDNKSTVNLAKNLVSHGRNRHIETKFHFLRDQVTKGLKLDIF